MPIAPPVHPGREPKILIIFGPRIKQSKALRGISCMRSGVNYFVFLALIGCLMGKARSAEFGLVTGIGEPFGRAGISIQIGIQSWYFSAARHFAWSDYTAGLAKEIFRIGGNHYFTAGASYGHNFEYKESEDFRSRVCFGIYDTHDFGKKSKFKSYYGFQLARYFVEAGDFAIVIPILGIGYFF
jgi:hypothetical protein